MNTTYPVYILSKGRANNCLTARLFIDDGLDHFLVVEKQEYKQYREKYKNSEILILPSDASGRGAVPIRNWIWNHSQKSGFKRHWEFDDNIRDIRRLHKGKRIPISSVTALNILEDFTNRYSNIGISGFNYQMFVINDENKPYRVNCHIYSAMLINNEMPFRWRLRYNADTDLCLQVLNSRKYCTVYFNILMANKMTTMKMAGGNTDRYKGNGRLIMARLLEKVWPQYVETRLRFNRPQHIINWKKHFNTPLIRRKDINWEEIKNKKYKIKLNKVSDI